MEVRIDALDVTVLKGGADEVGRWATEHGFRLPPDAPEVLDFYASRSPIFLAAVFDADAAAERGQAVGDGTPVHITIPTANPWVPLRILALGKTGEERVDADVFMLTDRRPALLPAPTGDNGLLARPQRSRRRTRCSTTCAPTAAWSGCRRRAWLTKVAIDSAAAQLAFDLAVDTSGARQPSRVMAGLDLPGAPNAFAAEAAARLLLGLMFSIGGIGGILLLIRRRPPVQTA